VKVLLVGWNENALRCIKSVLNSTHVLVGVVLPAGYSTSNIIRFCKMHDVRFEMADSDKELLPYIHSFAPEIMVSASCPWILKEEVFNAPSFGTINVHASLLPKNRGQHPLNWTLIKGENKTGVTIHYISYGIDDGDVILQEEIPIRFNDDINSLRDKSTKLGARLLVQALDLIGRKKEIRRPQNQAAATYAPKRTPYDGAINWQVSSTDIFNLIRALYDPYPNAFCYTEKGCRIEVTEALHPDNFGVVIGKYKRWFLVTTGDGVILVKAKKLRVGDKLYSSFPIKT